MDKKKVLELIKLEVLSCLNEKDKEVYEDFKLSNDDFPWKELGEYQHLVSLIPSILEIKYPANDLKDKTALKLYNIREEIKAKIEAKKAIEVPAEPVSEEIVLEEEPLVEEKSGFWGNNESEEKVLVEAEEGININSDKNVPGQGSPFKIKSNFKEKTGIDTFLQDSKTETESNTVLKTSPDKDLIEKTIREYLKSHVIGEIELLKKSIKTNKILSMIFFIVSLILILALYFLK